MNLLATMFSLITIGLLVILVVQLRHQRQATYELLADSRIRIRLFEDADESTSLILNQTIRSISEGRHDVTLENDAFTLRVIRELVKRNIPQNRWMEIQSNHRLVHELFLLLNRETCGNGQPEEQAEA